jgi:hypothetical protein
MASPERIYQGSVRAFSFVFIGIGLVILGRTLIAGGGPVSLGVILGVLFVAIGAGRLWIATRASR